jgi:hypothetical protein
MQSDAENITVIIEVGFEGNYVDYDYPCHGFCVPICPKFSLVTYAWIAVNSTAERILSLKYEFKYYFLTYLINPDPNPWMEAFNSGAFPVISTFLGGYALVVVALAIWKLSVCWYTLVNLIPLQISSYVLTAVLTWPKFSCLFVPSDRNGQFLRSACGSSYLLI